MSNIRSEFIDYVKSNIAESSLKKDYDTILASYVDGVSDSYLKLALDALKKSGCKFRFIRANSSVSYYRKVINVNITNSFDERRNAFFHEIGHIIDDIRQNKVEVNKPASFMGYAFVHKYKYIFTAKSSEITLSNGLTLDATIRSEIRRNGKDIYAKLMDDYKSLMDNIGELAYRYKRYYESCNEIKRLKRTFPYIYDPSIPDNPSDPLNRLNWKKFYKTREEAIEAKERYVALVNVCDPKLINMTREELSNHPEHIKFMRKYTALADALNCKYDFDGSFSVHSIGYFKYASSVGEEFFANRFADLVTSNTESLDLVERYLPESVKAFNELLNILMKGE